MQKKILLTFSLIMGGCSLSSKQADVYNDCFESVTKDLPPAKYEVLVYDDKDVWVLLNGKRLRVNNDKYQECLERAKL